MNPSRLLVRSALAATALAVASAASADMIRHTFGIDPSATDWAVDSITHEDNRKSFLLPRFDGTLGTLLSVSFHIDASLVSNVSVSNMSASSPNTLTNTVGGSFQMAENGAYGKFFDESVSNTWTKTFAINNSNPKKPVYDGVIGQQYTGVRARVQRDLSSTVGSVLSYVTTMDIANPASKLSFTMSAFDSSHTTDTAHNARAIYITKAQAAGWIEYEYTTQAVPEPASMAALGLGSLAMLRRRKAAKAGAR